MHSHLQPPLKRRSFIWQTPQFTWRISERSRTNVANAGNPIKYPNAAIPSHDRRIIQIVRTTRNYVSCLNTPDRLGLSRSVAYLMATLWLDCFKPGGCRHTLLVCHFGVCQKLLYRNGDFRSLRCRLKAAGSL